jgi:hypothetical protein
MVIKDVCRLYIDDCIKKSLSSNPVVLGERLREGLGKTKYSDKINQYKTFICPKYQSEAWVERFRILRFVIDNENYLFSPKVYNNNWDNQTKALWFRSIGMAPNNIAKRLCVNVATIEKHWIDRITKNYPLRPISQYDWVTIGENENRKVSNDPNRRKRVKFGGLPTMTAKQAIAPYQQQKSEQIIMDTQLNIARHKLKKRNSADDGLT